MAEEKKEQWLNYLALTTVILAVCATFATFYGQRHSTRAVLNQGEATNQWNYFQAKKIRSVMFEVQKDSLELDIQMRGDTLSPAQKDALKKRVEGYGNKIATWDTEMDGIQKTARSHEKAREEALVHGKFFGWAIIFLQMAILLSSISGLLKKRPVWYAGLAVGAVGLVFFANGFLLFM
ncbi:MAG: DUF4337 domain-containing protein [Pseudomonadota bacterium]